jgi:hypothetical protein
MKKFFFSLVVIYSCLSSFSQDIKKDRWIVMDFAWFNPATINQQADTLFDHYLPIWQKSSGDKGIILCFDWVVDLITEYSGDINQKLPFKADLSKWWNDKKYIDVKNFIDVLKQKAKEKNLENFHVGMECIAWKNLIGSWAKYNYPSAWSERHPELYKKYASLDPEESMLKDKYHYATRPKGIKNGESFAVFFGDQWGVVSQALDMDILLLWDSWATIRPYTRNGVFGERASKDASKNKAISDAIIKIYHELKRGNPAAILMAYSSGASAVGEYRVNTFDLEALVADGAVDVWIDQTWGGAWNDFWGNEKDGWTFQLAYQQQHALMVAAGNAKRTKPCRHYNIVGVFDAYESWDVIHLTPNKLRWSIWAYNNSCILTPKGNKFIDGSMVGWCNSPSMKLLTKEDVKLISETLYDADKSALRSTKIYGATTVYNRAMMEWLNAKDPASFNSEWIDEQSAMLMKWGVPCLSATRIEWLPQLDIDKRIWLYQLPGKCSDEIVSHVKGLAKTGCPQMFIGRADRIDQSFLQLAGISFKDTLYSSFDYTCIMAATAETGLPKTSFVRLSEFCPVKTSDAIVHVSAPESPLLTQANSSYTFYWQPPDWRHPAESNLPQQQYGSLVPYYCAARELERSCKKTGITHIRPVTVMNPVTFHYWKSGSRIYFLFGNLETNSIGDSRTKRDVFVFVNKDELGLDKGNYELKDFYGIRNTNAFGVEGSFLIYLLKIDPEGIGLYYIE